MSNKIKIFITRLCLIFCNCDSAYSMQNTTFKQQVVQYLLRMNEHNTRERDALRLNIIDHVYNDNMVNIYNNNDIGFDNSKLIALAMAANNNITE